MVAIKPGQASSFIGYLPVSGTACSSAVTRRLWVVMAKTPFFTLPDHETWYWLACMAVTAVSFYLRRAARSFSARKIRVKSSSMNLPANCITFIFIPVGLRILIAGFFLFRLFDIIKPYPVYYMEELEDGVGVTMDDVAAGIYANLSLLILITGYIS